MKTIGTFNPYKDYKPQDRIAFLNSDAEYYLAQANAYKKLAERAVAEIKNIKNLMEGDNNNE